MIELTIPGDPVAKQRAQVAYGRGYTPKQTRDAEDSIRWELRARRVRPLAGDVFVSLRFYVRDGGQQRDIDNLEKLVLDACNTIAYHDDQQVKGKLTWLLVDNQQPRTELTIQPLHEAQLTTPPLNG